MKRNLQFFLLILGCCFIQNISFTQEDINKEYAIKFTGYKTKLSKQASATVDSIASVMKKQPTWNYVISCCTVCNSRKSAAIWDRVNNIVNRLVEKYGIAAERFVISINDNLENLDEVCLRYTDEKVTTVAPPHPNLRKKNNANPCPKNSSSNF